MGGKTCPEMLHQGTAQFSIHQTDPQPMSKHYPIFLKLHICCLHESVPKGAREMARNLLTGLAGIKMLTRCSLRVKRTQSPAKSGKIQWPDDVICKLWLTITTQPLRIKVYGSINSYMGNIKKEVDWKTCQRSGIMSIRRTEKQNKKTGL